MSYVLDRKRKFAFQLEPNYIQNLLNATLLATEGCTLFGNIKTLK